MASVGREGLCFSAYLIIRSGTIAGESRAKMWHAMAQLCKASGNDKDVFERRASIWLCKRDRLHKSMPPSCETSNYCVTFLPVVLQRRPSLSKIFTQSFRLSFVNMRSDSPPPPPSRCGVCKAVSGFVNYFDGIYNYVGKFWRMFLD